MDKDEAVMQHTQNFSTGARAQVNKPHMQKPVSRVPRIALIVAGIVVALGVLGAAYIWFSGGSGQASAATTAPSLELQPGDTRSRFTMTPGETRARFLIDEVLLGSPKTVVGITDDVAGDMLIDLENPANSVLGVIRVNLRTLETDNEFRNRALRGQILQADEPENEFATFTPAQLTGLPDSVTIGEAFSFQVVGSLHLHGATRDVTFEATVTPVSETEVTGTARTVVDYRDFGMTIPEAPGVANVSYEVGVEIDFTAQTAQD